MKIKYFRTGCGDYLAVTDQCPKEFRDVLFIGKGPGPKGGPASVIEHVFSVKDVKGLQVVAMNDVPDEWLLALGYDKPLPKAPPPAPVPEPIWIDEPLPPLRRGRPRRQAEVENIELDIAFPWEVRAQKYGAYERKGITWYEIAAIVVAAVVSLAILGVLK